MGLLEASASMIITIISSAGAAVTSMPAPDMLECRKNMVAYVDEMPDMTIMRKTENTVVAEGEVSGRTQRFIVKCQPRRKVQ